MLSASLRPTPIILIAGPTASGKSAAAIALAQKHDGVVINADSMQVYKELRIITARPSVEDEALVPHYMYGHISGSERYSTGRWVKDVRKQIDATQQQGKLPIIIGGTGLYFRALIDGLVKIPEIPKPIREHWQAQSAQTETAALHKLLAARDPIMAERLKQGDTQRITRALEVLEATDKSLAYWQQQKDEPALSPQERQSLTKIVIAPPRYILYQRINQRFAWMVDAGGLEEVQQLKALSFDPALPLMRALGVSDLLAFQDGHCSKEEAIENASMMSRRYAKRQMTWLRGNMPEHAPSQENTKNTEKKEGWHWFKSSNKAKIMAAVQALPLK